MSLFAKLSELRAVKTQDSGGPDELSISRADGFQFTSISMHQGDVVDLDRLLPFDGQLEIVLREVDLCTDEMQDVGSIFIRSDELGRGSVTQQFRGAGARYDLTYKVI
ncbi:hypothetical protein M2272_000814 [Mycobacterium frederiksbergense]|uniref:Uncharacterized protein n=1 Tax=Mycolicibacterium frederiksbergense TaxID=117567 RepID=A0ABT6KUC5_9MYCO|nr:hypothetical protein [Mycolicibacterium frederiksbergense]MDH6194193.1 hypothetical protein [Mycolicibacterium frederiksbergense]